MKTRRFLEFAHKQEKANEDKSNMVANTTVTTTTPAYDKNRKPTNERRRAVVTPSPKRRKMNRSGDAALSPKTQSFDPLWDGTLSSRFFQKSIQTTTGSGCCTTSNTSAIKNPTIVEPHTLILGTHPSIASLSVTQYYAHPMNAFWWIVGDCLGFRRAKGTKRNGEPYQFTSDLRYTNVIPYEDQVERLIKSGFALWDIVGACHRPGSLDQDITDVTPNNVQAFCCKHPSIRRIVISNGSTGSKLFMKHNPDWLLSGQLVHSPDYNSKQTFGTKIQCADKRFAVSTLKAEETPLLHDEHWTSNAQILLISAISVSPAAARYSYRDKRAFWEEHVYKPTATTTFHSG